MMSSEREPITGVPQRGSGAEPPEHERLFALLQAEESANLSRNLFLENKKFVGRLGGPGRQ